MILILFQLISSYRESFHGKIRINSRSLFITFNHVFPCPKNNFGRYTGRESTLNTWCLSLIINVYLCFIWLKEDYQKPSENLTSFLMEIVMKNKKGLGTCYQPFSGYQIYLVLLHLFCLPSSYNSLCHYYSTFDFSWNHKTLDKNEENFENLNIWRSKRAF